MRYTAVMLFMIWFHFEVTAQQTESKGIKFPMNMEAKCGKCLEIINSMPPEVQFSVLRDEENNIYFTMSDQRWFVKLFKSGSDGVAVDVLSKSQFDCGGKNKIKNSYFNMGTLLNPVFYKDFKNNMRTDEMGGVVVKVGKVPAALRDQEIEFNLLIIKNKYLCYYQKFYDLERYKWDLLDMGLYLDSIEYGVNYDTSRSISSTEGYRQSRMKFSIPFEQNKSEYNEKDLKPFYDSLKLNDFNIKRIEIRAYASVEGSTERNKELQEKRAKSIIEVLQKNQVEGIEQKIKTSENWVEFYTAIDGTKHDKLSNLSKEEVKKRLEDKTLLNELEPILAKHRKAVILLDVERKTTLTMEKAELISAFEKALNDNNMEEAAELQRSIFTKVISNQLPETVLGEVEIPKQNKYGVLINNDIAFKHFLYPTDVLESYKEFQELDQLMPNNKKVKYNLCAMKFRVWLMGLEQIDPVEFEREIKALKKYKVSGALIKRMLVNFNVIMSEYYFVTGDYTKKDEALAFIKKNYRYVPMTNSDLLSLAQYFSAYARFDWATRLLTPHVKTLDADEDLLFYFINLTIVEPNMLKKSSYRTILLNAISINRSRFCKMFNSIEKGGISFQMLSEEELKKLFCQDCSTKLI